MDIQKNHSSYNRNQKQHSSKAAKSQQSSKSYSMLQDVFLHAPRSADPFCGRALHPHCHLFTIPPRHHTNLKQQSCAAATQQSKAAANKAASSTAAKHQSSTTAKQQQSSKAAKAYPQQRECCSRSGDQCCQSPSCSQNLPKVLLCPTPSSKTSRESVAETTKSLYFGTPNHQESS